MNSVWQSEMTGYLLYVGLPFPSPSYLVVIKYCYNVGWYLFCWIEDFKLVYGFDMKGSVVWNLYTSWNSLSLLRGITLRNAVSQTGVTWFPGKNWEGNSVRWGTLKLGKNLPKRRTFHRSTWWHIIKSRDKLYKTLPVQAKVNGNTCRNKKIYICSSL